MFKKTFLITIFGLIIQIVSIGCTPTSPTDSSAESQPAHSQRLEGTSWNLRAFNLTNKTSVPMENTELTIGFADGQASGGAGCNRYFGDYSREGETLEIGPLGATRMMCEENVMNQESSFLASLADAKSYFIDDSGLTIQLNNGTELVFDALAATQ